MTTPAMHLVPVGWVRRPSSSSSSHPDAVEIAIEPNFVEHCSNLDELSHCLVLWWAHERVDERFAYGMVHPQRRLDLPEVGLFCTRSPVRPNPVCADVVRLLAIEGNVLTVRGLQANDGTPVVDIKGWYDRVPDETPDQPPWFRRLRQR